jgi:hypothetical protein
VRRLGRGPVSNRPSGGELSVPGTLRAHSSVGRAVCSALHGSREPPRRPMGRGRVALTTLHRLPLRVASNKPPSSQPRLARSQARPRPTSGRSRGAFRASRLISGPRRPSEGSSARPPQPVVDIARQTGPCGAPSHRPDSLPDASPLLGQGLIGRDGPSGYMAPLARRVRPPGAELMRVVSAVVVGAGICDSHRALRMA